MIIKEKKFGFHNFARNTCKKLAEHQLRTHALIPRNRSETIVRDAQLSNINFCQTMVGIMNFLYRRANV